MLSEQDHDDLSKVVSLATEALHLLKQFEDKHGLDITGPAMSAFNRADVSLEFIPREIKIAERYLEEL